MITLWLSAGRTEPGANSGTVRVPAIARVHTASETASAKIRRVLPDHVARRLDTLLESLAFTDQPGEFATPDAGVLLTIADAVRHRRPVSIRYTDRDGRRSERSTRTESSPRPDRGGTSLGEFLAQVGVLDREHVHAGEHFARGPVAVTIGAQALHLGRQRGDVLVELPLPVRDASSCLDLGIGQVFEVLVLVGEMVASPAVRRRDPGSATPAWTHPVYV
ncbi:hypothetical protein [Nonomuraea diastatica]|uniref:hypothetical protein n=1 Tax=Nonomuraea diastatica TaxID=1848329 RepID=UPI001C70439B|nr:hypothetical protein [Nonomuraea diastatica]